MKHPERRTGEYPFDRLTVPEPERVEEQKQDRDSLTVLFIAGMAAILIVALLFRLAPAPKAVAETWPDVGPSSVFGQTLAPEPVTCPACTCPDCTFLSRFVYRLDVESTNPREVRDVLHRAFVESRYTPSSVSDTGDWASVRLTRQRTQMSMLNGCWWTLSMPLSSVCACTGWFTRRAAPIGSAVTGTGSGVARAA